jgi:peptidoglycan-associated lipoprotein
MKPSIAGLMIAGLVACSHAQPAPEAAATSPQPAPAPVASPAPAPPPAPTVAPPVVVPTESIYFDFDKSNLTPPGEEFLARLGSTLEKYPELNLRIEGNCDERGSEEYNIALGQRRADTAKNYLVRMGARGTQISTISYGKDRPRGKGHDEDAWRQNRRDDFIPDRTTLPARPVSERP